MTLSLLPRDQLYGMTVRLLPHANQRVKSASSGYWQHTATSDLSTRKSRVLHFVAALRVTDRRDRLSPRHRLKALHGQRRRLWR